MKITKFTLVAVVYILIVSCSQDGWNGSYDNLGFGMGGSGLGPGGEYIEPGGDNYNDIVENPFVEVTEEPVSTFSIDADGASYANVRRFLEQDQILPPANAVRTEEFINYFDLNYNYVSSSHPISMHGEISSCPWNEENKLIRIGIVGKSIPENQLPNSNFVFLIDVSGSMSSPSKLDLLKKGFISFAEEMRDDDRVAIVTYASNPGVLLKSTKGTEKNKIISAISELGSGGSTAGAGGIKKAYDIAEDNFIEGGNNRIIMGTDGDFNVGISSQEELVELIEEERESGVYLTVLGVGRGNLNDGGMEQLANNGNGTYEYIDKEEQLKKVFLYDYNKFYAVAKDVKVQVEFSAQHVKSYRLIGYENRVLENEDFEDDKKDAGEIGSGQNITALYEIVPQEYSSSLDGLPSFTIDFRYKMPDSDTSIPMELKVLDGQKSFEQSSDHMKFTAGVASFALLLRDSEYKGETSYDKVLDWTADAIDYDPHGFKAEFRELVNTAKAR